MRARVFQHVSFEGSGSIAGWLEERDAEIEYTRFFAGDPVPSLDGTDLLIALGGPMSANDEAELPWLRVEKQRLREAIAAGIPVLGVCLGAQLIASALGAKVYRNAATEIGWFPVRGIAHGQAAFRFPAECTVFHWHGETFDLPERALRLATSQGCTNQAFQIGRNVIGLQFHLETRRDNALALLEHCGDEMTRGPFVQPAQEIRAVSESAYRSINRLMSDVLTYLMEPRPEDKG
jgi:GMP synthase-like glutamine amidotransferase